MKKNLLLLAFVLLVFAVSVKAQNITLPKSCQKILDTKFRGWKFAKVSRDILDYHKKAKIPFKPNLIKGDWNGDGKTDYAVLIEKGTIKLNGGQRIPRLLTIAFLKTAKEFSYRTLDEGGDYIQVFKKGEKDYD